MLWMDFILCIVSDFLWRCKMIDRGKELLYTAISLARMYGISECLNDIPFIQQGKVNDMIDFYISYIITNYIIYLIVSAITFYYNEH